MATYVLIHGGFSGGWIWREVASLLRTAGYEVFTPTLTGLGERVIGSILGVENGLIAARSTGGRAVKMPPPLR